LKVNETTIIDSAERGITAAVGTGFHPSRESPLEVLADHSEVVPLVTTDDRPFLMRVLARRHTQRPRSIRAIGVRLDREKSILVTRIG
jgi:hypothetical protein